MTDAATIDRLTGESVALLQTMIRNQCVNDGTPESGEEDRTARLLRDELEGTGVDLAVFEPMPGRTSLVARHRGTDPTAPALCLMGHTDVVPVSPDGWDRDPFGGELVGEGDEAEIWGRGAVDMLNLTSTMAVAFKHLVTSGKRYPGDIVYFAVADEEAGGTHGAEVLVRDEWDALKCDYVLTEFGGFAYHRPEGSTLLVTTAEKGVGWRRLTVKGTPGHGSRPLGADSALIKAAEIVRRLAEFEPAAKLDDLWEAKIIALGLDPDLTARLLDPGAVQEAIHDVPRSHRANLHSCAHMSFSPNVIHGGVKTNVIPDVVELEVDIRTLPGETGADVDANLREAIGDLFDDVEVSIINDDPSSASPAGGPLWESLTDAMHMAYPGVSIIPSMVTGGTDSRFFRQRGVTAYGAGLLSPTIDAGQFFDRFHGHNERIDVASLRMTTQLWLDVADRLWAHT
jgi:acetylornithine deacetylase/succinyl-diaminopimelate desuccinylase-like protein